jgi:hypothetical protein
MQAPKGRTRRLQRRALSALCTPCCRPIAPPLIPEESHTALRISLQPIVMSVMSVICLYLKGLHMTVNC